MTPLVLEMIEAAKRREEEIRELEAWYALDFDGPND